MLTLEEPKRSCKITTGSTAPTQPPVYYGKGLDQHFPAVEQPELAAAHAINTRCVVVRDGSAVWGRGAEAASACC